MTNAPPPRDPGPPQNGNPSGPQRPQQRPPGPPGPAGAQPPRRPEARPRPPQGHGRPPAPPPSAPGEPAPTRPTVVAGSDAARAFLEGPSGPQAPTDGEKADRKKKEKRERKARREAEPKPKKAKAKAKQEPKQRANEPPAQEAAVPSPGRGPAGVAGGYEEQLAALAELPSNRLARRAVRTFRKATKRTG